MKNIKDKVYEALLTVSKHVSDSYPGTAQKMVYRKTKLLSGTGLISGTERARQQQHLPWMRQ